MKHLLVVSLILIITVTSSGNVAAISPEQRRVIDSGILYYNTEDNACLTTPGGNTQTSGPATSNMIDFIDTYGQAAFDIGKQYGIPYEAILAKAMLESNYGRSSLTVQGFNFFGMKSGSSWTGPVISLPTKEQDGSGSEYTVVADFRVYANAEEGFRGYGEFIHNNNRYANALNFPGNPIQYITEVRAAGYATDVNYVSKLTPIVNQVVTHIADNDLFPPSSEVTPDVAPPNPVGSPVPSGGSSSCPSSTAEQGGTGGEPGSNKELGRRMVAERGWGDSEFTCLDKIWTQESNWVHTANNPISSAYGIPQAMISVHKADIDANYSGFYEREIQGTPGRTSTYDYEGGDPAIQIKWGLDYIVDTYGTPCEASVFKDARGWY